MKSFTVIYRTGGKLNFQWKKCLPIANKAKALADKAEIERMGYPALLFDTVQLEAIGLPETYNAETPIENNNI